MKYKTGILFAVSALVLMAGFAFATPSPNGPGQPGAPNTTCGSAGATNMPPGFGTAGFAHAGSVYAGSPGTASLAHANSVHALAQYDIACFQHTQH